jgi:signal transduction histidine kinase
MNNDLSGFLTDHMEEILCAWEEFARKLGAVTEGMSRTALRDHAQEMLCAIAADIRTRQSAADQQKKSEGRASETGDSETAASIHGWERQANSFSMEQLSSEYRALRATVLRLWLPEVFSKSDASMEQMVRFNEGIDQALAESIATYSDRAGEARDLFLAILGHDLRAPLAAMDAAADVLLHPKTPGPAALETGNRVKRGVLLMSNMVADLNAYTRSQLGTGLPIAVKNLNLDEICRWAVDDAGAANPGCHFIYQGRGDLSGHFDGVRLHQLFTNLLFNAAQYGSTDQGITIFADGESDAIVVQVTNHGPVIPEASWRAIFKPLIRLPSAESSDERSTTSSGLGLFIAREIATAHGGEISVTSDIKDGTTFTVRLPRSAKRNETRKPG